MLVYLLLQSIIVILLSSLGSDGVIPHAKVIGIGVLSVLFSLNFAWVSQILSHLGLTYTPGVRLIGVLPPNTFNFSVSFNAAQLSQVIMCHCGFGYVFVLVTISNTISAMTLYFFILDTIKISPNVMSERVLRCHWLWKLYFPNNNNDDLVFDV